MPRVKIIEIIVLLFLTTILGFFLVYAQSFQPQIQMDITGNFPLNTPGTDALTNPFVGAQFNIKSLSRGFKFECNENNVACKGLPETLYVINGENPRTKQELQAIIDGKELLKLKAQGMANLDPKEFKLLPSNFVATFDTSLKTNGNGSAIPKLNLDRFSVSASNDSGMTVQATRVPGKTGAEANVTGNGIKYFFKSEIGDKGAKASGVYAGAVIDLK